MSTDNKVQIELDVDAIREAVVCVDHIGQLFEAIEGLTFVATNNLTSPPDYDALLVAVRAMARMGTNQIEIVGRALPANLSDLPF